MSRNIDSGGYLAVSGCNGTDAVLFAVAEIPELVVLSLRGLNMYNIIHEVNIIDVY